MHRGIMKKLLVLLFILSGLVLEAQDIIENPEKPIHPDAGRVLKMEEVYRIKSEGEDYYFRGANELKVDVEGHIFISDYWSSANRSHFVHFSPEGKFIRDLYRQGEGPGEINSGFGFALTKTGIFVLDYMKRKIIIMEKDGRFLSEFKLQLGSINEFLGIYNDWLLFMRREYPPERKTSKLYDIDNVIFGISKDGKSSKEFVTLQNQQFLISLAKGGGSMSWDPFMAVLGGDKIYLCRSQEYLIEVFDLNQGQVAGGFTRKYPRVKHVMRDWEKDFINRNDAPGKRYAPDIEEIVYDDRGRLWIRTSTENEMGILYDVFSTEGKFLDSFYVPTKRKILAVDQNALFSSEIDEEEFPYVVKHRIMEPIGNKH
jgi:hypothetical protein